MESEREHTLHSVQKLQLCMQETQRVSAESCSRRDPSEMHVKETSSSMACNRAVTTTVSMLPMIEMQFAEGYDMTTCHMG